jgi:hypothetical protein
LTLRLWQALCQFLLVQEDLFAAPAAAQFDFGWQRPMRSTCQPQQAQMQLSIRWW